MSQHLTLLGHRGRGKQDFKELGEGREEEVGQRFGAQADDVASCASSSGWGYALYLHTRTLPAVFDDESSVLLRE